MGKYMAQAAAFSGAIGSVAGSLSGIDGKCSGIQKIVSDYSSDAFSSNVSSGFVGGQSAKVNIDAICTNVSSRLGGIQSAKEAIIANLRSIAQKVSVKAIELDEEEEKRMRQFRNKNRKVDIYEQ